MTPNTVSFISRGPSGCFDPPDLGRDFAMRGIATAPSPTFIDPWMMFNRIGDHGYQVPLYLDQFSTRGLNPSMFPQVQWVQESSQPQRGMNPSSFSQPAQNGSVPTNPMVAGGVLPPSIQPDDVFISALRNSVMTLRKCADTADAADAETSADIALQAFGSCCMTMGLLVSRGMWGPETVGRTEKPVTRGDACRKAGDAIDNFLQRYSSGRGVGADLGEVIDRVGDCYREFMGRTRAANATSGKTSKVN